MKKNVIKLNEEQLRKVVTESIKNVLNEAFNYYGFNPDMAVQTGERFIYHGNTTLKWKPWGENMVTLINDGRAVIGSHEVSPEKVIGKYNDYFKVTEQSMAQEIAQWVQKHFKPEALEEYPAFAETETWLK